MKNNYASWEDIVIDFKKGLIKDDVVYTYSSIAGLQCKMWIHGCEIGKYVKANEEITKKRDQEIWYGKKDKK